MVSTRYPYWGGKGGQFMAIWHTALFKPPKGGHLIWVWRNRTWRKLVDCCEKGFKRPNAPPKAGTYECEILFQACREKAKNIKKPKKKRK